MAGGDDVDDATRGPAEVDGDTTQRMRRWQGIIQPVGPSTEPPERRRARMHSWSLAFLIPALGTALLVYGATHASALTEASTERLFVGVGTAVLLLLTGTFTLGLTRWRAFARQLTVGVMVAGIWALWIATYGATADLGILYFSAIPLITAALMLPRSQATTLTLANTIGLLAIPPTFAYFQHGMLHVLEYTYLALFGIFLGAVGAVAAAAVERTHLVLQHQTAQLEEARLQRLQFINIVAHDLANPLTPILLQTSMLAGPGGQDPARQRAGLDMIHRNIGQIERLTEDWRQLAEMEVAGPTDRPRPTDLAGIARTTTQAFQPTAQEAGVTLRTDAPDPVPLVADPDRLHQVAINLVSNAIKYTPRGGRVVVRAARTDQEATLDVTDTGIGLPGDAATRLFQPFERLHDPHAHRAPGTGLGLYISHQIAAGHGGTLTAQSPGPGHGSTFTLRLPVAGLAAAPHAIPQRGRGRLDRTQRRIARAVLGPHLSVTDRAARPHAVALTVIVAAGFLVIGGAIIVSAATLGRSSGIVDGAGLAGATATMAALAAGYIATRSGRVRTGTHLALAIAFLAPWALWATTYPQTGTHSLLHFAALGPLFAGILWPWRRAAATAAIPLAALLLLDRNQFGLAPEVPATMLGFFYLLMVTIAIAAGHRIQTDSETLARRADAVAAAEDSRRLLVDRIATRLTRSAAALRRALEEPDRWTALPSAARMKRLHALAAGAADVQLLVENVKDLAKLEAGMLRLTREPTRLDALVADIIEDEFPRPGRIEVAMLPRELLHVDPVRVRQVLLTLLRTAVDAAPPDQRVGIRHERRRAEMLIHVDQPGPGIDLARLPDLFDPMRPRAGRAEPLPGSGLELFVARGIASAHAGRLDATSAGPGRGITYTLHLPREPPHPTVQ